MPMTRRKLLLEVLGGTTGVDVRLHTRVCATLRSGRRVTHAVTESRSGREAAAGGVFIDATRDGDLVLGPVPLSTLGIRRPVGPSPCR